MLARLAENMYWAGRYVERAENTARLLDTTYHGLLEAPPATEGSAWSDLLDVLNLSEAYTTTGEPLEAQAVTAFLVADRDNPGSIRSSVAAARDNIRSLREEVSTELWEAVNAFYLELGERNLDHDVGHQPFQVYGLVRRRCQAINGVADETMPRRDGWRFLALGRQLERVTMTTRLLSVYFRQPMLVETPVAFHDWVVMLKAAAALEAFRRADTVSVDPSGAVEYLLTDDDFPRSVLFCLREAEEMAAELGTPDIGTGTRRLLGRLRSSVEYCDLEVLLTGGLQTFLERLLGGFERLHTEVSDEYFRLAVHRQLRALGRN
jgi:uncharacterized alpha-E superfamily protein